MRKFAVIGVPSSAGARQVGQDRAPAAFRRAGLLEQLRTCGHDVLDFAELPRVVFRPDPWNPRRQNLEWVSLVCRQVADAVDRALDRGFTPVVLGGDCTVTLGVIAGCVPHAPNLGLVYFDGDLDLNTPDNSPSGIFDGMGMAHIIGEGAEELTHLASRFPLMPQDKIVLFGYNPDSGWIDPAEQARLASCAMHKFPIGKIRGRPLEAATEALAKIDPGTDRLLVHFDVDVIDQDEFPVADVPHKHGLGFQEAMTALSVFAASEKFAGLVITEFNADRDGDGVYASLFVDALLKVLGSARD